MSEHVLTLSPFDIRSSCRKNFNAVVVGKKNTGKSTVIQDLLYYLSKTGIPRACVFSGTEESNGFYSKYIPGTYIFADDNVEDTLIAIVNNQKKMAMQKHLGEIDPNVDTRIVIVLDDVAYQKGVLKSQIVRQIFMNGRHHSIILIVAVQYCMDVGIDLRTNADFVYILKQNAVSSIKNLHENYFGAFEKRKDFQTVLDACTQDYQCLVLDNTRPSTNVPDTCFWYKAKLGRSFKVGSSEFWDFHRKWHMSDEDKYLETKKNSQNNQALRRYNSARDKKSSKGHSLIVNKKRR